MPRSIVERAVEIALESPTACNRQPYEFYLVDEPSLVPKVAAVPMGTAGYVHGLTALAVIVGDLSAFADERDRHLIYIDGSLAAMSFILALEAPGVSTLCINWPDIRSREQAMAQLLRLEQHQRIVMLVAYGFADEQARVPFSQKKPVGMAHTFVSSVS
ncbi:nitroreductase family protein [Agromyces larvae]|uniref:Nitroreductase family protein n=1 Tax=Agromyces larvae TaxID=2929802 RepID=A0ABY4BYI4_9MICO|nr:nitroreductase family protein [Agromyces larvae]